MKYRGETDLGRGNSTGLILKYCERKARVAVVRGRSQFSGASLRASSLF